MRNDRPQSLARAHPRQSKRFNLLLLAAFVLFGIGIIAPILTFEKFFIFSNRVSILSGLFQLLTEGHPVLFILILVFSIVLPCAKLFLLFRVWNGRFENREKHERLLHWIARYGKWSMLDVFVAAMLIVTVRLGAIADVEVHYGLYCFAASVVLTMLATSRVANLTQSASDQQ
jgi:paraquat-inducible protein A